MNNGILPIEQEVLKQISEKGGKVGNFQLEQFNAFKHAFNIFENDIFANCNTIADLNDTVELLEKSYRQILEFLSIDESQSADDLSFNLWVTPRMMFIGVRETDAVEGEDGAKVELNTLGFTGTMALKNQQSLELLKEVKPLEVLNLIAKKTDQ